MSVMVKGMRMPKSCSYCDFYNMRLVRCTRIPKWLEIDVCNYRDKECPLVEVPVPHGGLLDENDVIDAIHDRLHELQTHKEFQKKHGDIDLLGVMPYIAKIQPVIEAEGTE